MNRALKCDHSLKSCWAACFSILFLVLEIYQFWSWHCHERKGWWVEAADHWFDNFHHRKQLLCLWFNELIQKPLRKSVSESNWLCQSFFYLKAQRSLLQTWTIITQTWLEIHKVLLVCNWSFYYSKTRRIVSWKFRDWTFNLGRRVKFLYTRGPFWYTNWGSDHNRGKTGKHRRINSELFSLSLNGRDCRDCRQSRGSQILCSCVHVFMLYLAKVPEGSSRDRVRGYLWRRRHWIGIFFSP